MATTCTHLDQIRDVEPRTPDGCEECLQTGGQWVHLRLCLTCGHVGCCDSSPNKHATKHFHATEHPVIQSFEPNEDWSWCYVDQVVLEPSDIEAAVEASRRSISETSVSENGQSAGAPGGLLSRLLGSRHRRNYVVGVIDDASAAQRAVESVQRDGFASEEVVLQTGQEIEERMRSDDVGNLVRVATTEEGSICRDFNERSRGGAVVSVYTAGSDEVERARRALVEHGAHSLKHFGTWTITALSAGHAGTGTPAGRGARGEAERTRSPGSG